MSTGELIPNKADVLPVEVQPDNLISVIERLSIDPRVDIDKLERIIALKERLIADQRKTAFMAAMARLQAKLPQMGKYGQAKNSKFSKLEDIDRVIRPLLAEEGFSFSFNEEAATDKTMTFIALLSHCEGHAESKRLTVPIDVASKNSQGVPIRPAIQDSGSTVSYARRYLLKMHLNIVETNEDTDGEKRETITEEQALDLQAKIDEVKMDLGKFLVYMHAGELKDILVCDLKTAYNAIDVKRRNPK